VRSNSGPVASASLLPYLRVFYSDGEVRPVPPSPPPPSPPVTIEFLFSVPDPFRFDNTDNYLKRYGFNPDAGTGAVTLARGPKDPDQRVISNFIITCRAQIPGGTSEFYFARIRIHIHEERKSVVLQPNPLHLRRGIALRLSVLAQFKNGVLGDLSYHPNVNWEPSSSLVVGPDPHSSAADKERAFKDGGFISVATNTGDATGTIKAVLPQNLGGPSTAPGDGEALVRILPGWHELPKLPDDTDPYKAQFIVGPGIARRNQPSIRNVLFLPEGFRENEEAIFEQLADHLAYGMRALPAFRPFDVLGFNVFRLWVQPHADVQRSGVTEHQELIIFNDGQTFRGKTVPHPTEPAGTPPVIDSSRTKEDEIVEDVASQLVFLVGLPASGETMATLEAQKTEWNRVYQNGHVTFTDKVTLPLQERAFKRWTETKQRGITIETDTLFQLATGARPRADVEPRFNLIGPHPLRYTREDLDPLLSKIYVVETNSTVPIAIGNELWVSHAAKDVNLVYFITRGQHSAGTNWESGKRAPADPAQPNKPRRKRRQMAATMTDITEPLYEEGFEKFFPVTHVGPFFTNILGDKIRIPPSHYSVICHELAHSLSCGDEYGSQGTTAADVHKPFIDDFWNIQYAPEVGGTAAGTPVQPDKIRWRWPRIDTAGVMASALAPVAAGGTRFRVTMRNSHGDEFAKEDKVRYRPADLLIRPTPGDILQFRQSPALFAVKDRVAKNVLELELLEPPPGSFNNDSAAGMILYKPRPDSAGKDELIIHPAILANMASAGVLSRRAASCDPTTGSDGDIQTPRSNLPSGVQYPKLKSSIIGLYDGGANFRCGVYHATGKCIMRLLTWIRAEHGGKTIDYTPFCHVCRYILVDRVNPRRHDVINNNRSFKPPV
jgi:hypothetical protein